MDRSFAEFWIGLAVFAIVLVAPSQPRCSAQATTEVQPGGGFVERRSGSMQAGPTSVYYPRAVADKQEKKPETPPYKLLRYESDYAYLKDLSQSTDCWDALKYIPFCEKED